MASASAVAAGMPSFRTNNKHAQQANQGVLDGAMQALSQQGHADLAPMLPSLTQLLLILSSLPHFRFFLSLWNIIHII